MQIAALNDDLPQTADDQFLAALSDVQAGAEAARMAFCRGLNHRPHLAAGVNGVALVQDGQRRAIAALVQIAGLG